MLVHRAPPLLSTRPPLGRRSTRDGGTSFDDGGNKNSSGLIRPVLLFYRRVARALLFICFIACEDPKLSRHKLIISGEDYITD